jgi:DNA-binding response OmpR family regulator
MEAAVIPVLIVDDDPDIRESLREILAEAGYAVSEAPDGSVALDKIQTAPEPTVVLLDLLLPELDGAALLGIVARNHRLAMRHSFILMTGKPLVAFPVLKKLAADMGASIVSKPFDLPMLLDVVAHAADRLRPATDTHENAATTAH